MNIEQKTTIAAPIISGASEVFQLTLWPFAVAFVFAFSLLVDMEKSSAKSGLYIVARSSLIAGALSQLVAPFILLFLGHTFEWADHWSKTDSAAVSMTALLSIILSLTVHKILPKALQIIGDYKGNTNV